MKNRPEVALRPWEGTPFHNSPGPGLIYRSKTVPVYNRWDVTLWLYEGLSGTRTIKSRKLFLVAPGVDSVNYAPSAKTFIEHRQYLIIECKWKSSCSFTLTDKLPICLRAAWKPHLNHSHQPPHLSLSAMRYNNLNSRSEWNTSHRSTSGCWTVHTRKKFPFYD